MVQSFPNINKQTTISSDELNNLKSHLTYVSAGAGWDFGGSTINNVNPADADNAVEPRWYNDERYLRKGLNLDDLTNTEWAFANAFNKISTGGTCADSMRRIVNDISYPVGSVYINASRGDNPANYLGVGTWLAWAEGRVMVGCGTTTDDRGEARNIAHRQMGGEFQHVLTTGEMPNHSHPMKQIRANPALNGGIAQEDRRLVGAGYGQTYDGNIVGDTGGGGSHNNMMPYLGSYMWIRIG